jgi:hypothetical protein
MNTGPIILGKKIEEFRSVTDVGLADAGRRILEDRLGFVPPTIRLGLKPLVHAGCAT